MGVVIGEIGDGAELSSTTSPSAPNAVPVTRAIAPSDAVPPQQRTTVGNGFSAGGAKASALARRTALKFDVELASVAGLGSTGACSSRT